MAQADYADVPGNVVSRLPIVAGGATLHAFLLPSNFDDLRKICDRVLNLPSGGAVSFRPALPVVLFTDLTVARITSGDPVDAAKGFVSEADLGFWILTLGGPAHQPLDWRLRWLAVYLFVDSGPALVGGREIFGYPKHLGRFIRPASGGIDVSVQTLHFRTFGPNVAGAEETLVQFTSNHRRGEILGDLHGEISQLFNVFSDFRLPSPLDGLAAKVEQISLPYLRLPTVFLKQFRDAVVANQSCFTAVLETVAHTTALGGGGKLTGNGQLALSPSMSHPIAEDLGLSATNPVGDGFFVELDFTVGAGSTIWKP